MHRTHKPVIARRVATKPSAGSEEDRPIPAAFGLAVDILLKKKKYKDFSYLKKTPGRIIRTQKYSEATLIGRFSTKKSQKDIESLCYYDVIKDVNKKPLLKSLPPALLSTLLDEKRFSPSWSPSQQNITRKKPVFFLPYTPVTITPPRSSLNLPYNNALKGFCGYSGKNSIYSLDCYYQNA